MTRRDFITLLGGAAAGWPLAARAQQAERMRRIGVLLGHAKDPTTLARMTALQRGLEELGWKEGRNLQVEQRWAAADMDRIRGYSAELASLKPDVLVASPAQVLLVLQQAAPTIPMVFVGIPDPVELGIVASLARPGGNATGFTNFEHSMAGKWLEILKEIVPGMLRVGIIYSPDNPAWPARLRLMESAAPSFGLSLTAKGVRDPAEIERAVAEFAHQSHGGFIVLPSIFNSVHRELIVALASRHRLPAVYPGREYTEPGGLISYGIDTPDVFRRSAVYVDRILKGAKPSDLPVQQPTKFELVINLKAAKALGIEVPPTLLALADEVIE